MADFGKQPEISVVTKYTFSIRIETVPLPKTDGLLLLPERYI
jgi:hypothetical protein